MTDDIPNEIKGLYPFFEREIIYQQAVRTCAKINEFFIKHNKITKKEFMDMQSDIWSLYKKELLSSGEVKSK